MPVVGYVTDGTGSHDGRIFQRDGPPCVAAVGDMNTMKCFCFLLAMASVFMAGCATRRLNYIGGVSNCCELHQVKMSKTTVPVLYNLVPVDECAKAREAACETSFPNARQWVAPPGLVVPPGAPTEAVIYSCPICEIVREHWELNSAKW
jgi:hypothetical protein